MPQLNKGGKFVFGLSVIRSDLTIHIPPQALLEYDTTRDGKVIMQDENEVFNSFINIMVQIVEKYGKTVLQELDCAA